MGNQADKWDRRYQKSGHNLSKAREFLLTVQDLLPKVGWGLDIAMGMGHNAAVLSSRGLKVIGVDFSKVALKSVKTEYPLIHTILVDLPVLHLKKESVDVILNFWFLDRRLYPFYRHVLKPDGLLIFETMRFDGNNLKTDVNPAYLLQPGELLHVFADWEFLIYDENVPATAQHKARTAVRLAARKP